MRIMLNFKNQRKTTMDNNDNIEIERTTFKIIQNTLATQRPESCVCCPNMWTGIVFLRKKGKQQQQQRKQPHKVHS